jgi:monomeric sarcosine oxidase
MSSSRSYDVAVVGAGVFGAWTAWHLAKRKQRVLLLEAYGPGHSRASSGGETRIIRMSYGPDEIYTRWSQRSLVQWRDLFAASGERLFHQTGVLWLAGKDEMRLCDSAGCLQRCGITHQIFDHADLEKRYPQVNFDSITHGLLEPESGVLLARRAVSCTAQNAVQKGVTMKAAQVVPPQGTGQLEFIDTASGECISAGKFVFACGPWLGKMFPEWLSSRIFPTRQEVFFFAPPAGDTRFAPPTLPTWLFQDDEVYGLPDIESRGLKLACDKHGETIDPDTRSRLVSPAGAEWARTYVAHRFPALKDAPIVETRVCQYENTSSGDFLIDRHPELSNVWLVGGGSGHGFKHGPALGEYVANLLLGEGTAEPQFALANKAARKNRTVH